MNNRAKPVDGVLPSTVSSIDVDLLATLFDQAPDVAFFIKDALGRYVVVNDSLLDRHGLESKVEAIGKRPSEICPGVFGHVPSFRIATGVTPSEFRKQSMSKQPIVMDE